jgi:hypothetical protein
MSAGNVLRNAISAGAKGEDRSGTSNPTMRALRLGGEGPNGAGRMAFALARLRKSDEARSEALERDPRVYQPDPDETTERPCGGRWQP